MGQEAGCGGKQGVVRGPLGLPAEGCSCAREMGAAAGS